MYTVRLSYDRLRVLRDAADNGAGERNENWSRRTIRGFRHPPYRWEILNVVDLVTDDSPVEEERDDVPVEKACHTKRVHSSRLGF